MRKKLIFLGHAGNIQRLIDVAIHHYDLAGIVDDNYYGNTHTLDNLPVIGTEKNIDVVLLEYPGAVFFAVPALRNATDWSLINPRRAAMIKVAEDRQLCLINLIDSTAVVPETTVLGKNIFVGAYTVFQNHVTVEDYAFIKEQVCVAHNSIIKKNANLSTQCYIGSDVVIGENSYIGIKGAVIASGRQLEVGANSITHPGVIVMKDLPNNSIATIGGKVKGSFDPKVID
jgi:hypothetical protein